MTTRPLAPAELAPAIRQKAMLALSLLALCTLGLCLSASAQKAAFTTFDPPGSVETIPNSTNLSGAITGFYFDANFLGHSFLRSPDGHITTSAATATGPSTDGQIAFKRRWIVEQNVPVTGVRRVTVLVTLENTMLHPPVTFQMSMVRP